MQSESEGTPVFTLPLTLTLTRTLTLTLTLTRTLTRCRTAPLTLTLHVYSYLRLQTLTPLACSNLPPHEQVVGVKLHVLSFILFGDFLIAPTLS